MLSHLADDADRCYARVAGPDERFAGLMPDLLEGVKPRAAPRRVPAGHDAAAAAARRPVPRRADHGQRRRRDRRAARRAAPRRPALVPPPHRRARRPDGGDRPLPGTPGAVQAGDHRAGPDSSGSATSRWPWTGDQDDTDLAARFALVDEYDGLSDGRRSSTSRAERVADARHGGRAGDRGDRDGRAPSRCRRRCSPSWSSGPSARVEELCARLARRYAEAGHGFELVRVAGGYRYQSHADLAPYVERYVLDGQRARLSARGAGDAGDRRLQATDLAGPGGRDPRRRPRRRAAHPAGAGLHHRAAAATPAPARRCCGAPRRRSSRSSASTRSHDLPPLAEFVPGADVVEALEHGLRITDDEPSVPSPVDPEP